MAKRSERLVVRHDTGWVNDGHAIAWDEGGCWITHRPDCPFYDDDGTRYFVCSPGHQEDAFGIFLNDLPDEEFERCFMRPHGCEPFVWRLREHLHPDLDDEQTRNLAIFEVALDEEDSRND